MTHNDFQTAGEEWLASSAAGALASGKTLALACQAEMQPSLAARLAELDTIGGTLLESAHGDEISDDFLDRMIASLDEPRNERVEASNRLDVEQGEATWLPNALHAFLTDANIDLKWRRAGPGIQRAHLMNSQDGERVYLLRAEPGCKMPMHSHSGEEWTLILQGSYHVGSEGFGVGDLHCEDDECEHQPIIDAGEACICLVVDDGPLKFRNPLLKLLQPLLRI